MFLEFVAPSCLPWPLRCWKVEMGGGYACEGLILESFEEIERLSCV